VGLYPVGGVKADIVFLQAESGQAWIHPLFDIKLELQRPQGREDSKEMGIITYCEKS
jgi:hypothetical protein